MRAVTAYGPNGGDMRPKHLRDARHTRQRRLQAVAKAIASASAAELPALLERFAAAQLELEALDGDGPHAPELEACIDAIAQTGPRLVIGLPTLDAATRGGIPLGRFVAILGGPGSSKTNLATWLGDGWERAGCGVLYVAADEAREAIVTRIGQLDGHNREALEDKDPRARAAFMRRARGRHIRVIDPFEDRITLEQCEAELVSLADGRPRVLIVDSLQRVPASGAAALDTKREQLEYVVGYLDGLAKRGTLVIGISEMSRAGYRTGKRETDISALAAGAESRAIEFAAHLLVGLKPVRSAAGIVELEVAKNRLGPDKPEIRLRLDFSTLAIREAPRPVDDGVEREREKSTALRARILAACGAEECRSFGAITRAAAMRRRDGNAVIRELLEEGLLHRVEGVYRPRPPGPIGVPS